ncbi:MAG: hypothetical protein AAFP86_11445, partial [Planctomycetota bacterium]
AETPAPAEAEAPAGAPASGPARAPAAEQPAERPEPAPAPPEQTFTVTPEPRRRTEVRTRIDDRGEERLRPRSGH